MEGRKMLVLSSRLNRILKIQNVRYFITMRYFLLKCNVLLKVSVVHTPCHSWREDCMLACQP